jgi:hypothetical protein
MQQRQPFDKTITLQDRLEDFAKEMRHKADKLAPGSERDELLSKASQADAAANIDKWIHSPGWRPSN